MKTEIKLQGLDGVLATLQALPREIVSKRGGPVRAALRKGAKAIHGPAVRNLEEQLNRAADADDAQSTGLLLKNVVITRGKEPVGSKGERFLVRVRRKSYQRRGAQVTTLKTAHLKEYGSAHQAPAPWLVPAFKAHAAEAIGVIQADLLRSIDRIVRKLARANARRGRR